MMIIKTKNHPHDENGGHYHDWDWSRNSPRGDPYVPNSNDMSMIIVGVAIMFVCVVVIAIVIADDSTGVGVVDDWTLVPLYYTIM